MPKSISGNENQQITESQQITVLPDGLLLNIIESKMLYNC